MDIKEFEFLLSQEEGETLDFKKQQYDFTSDDSVGKFVKDIVSFANTKRTTTSYIIVGVEQTLSGKSLHGLDKNYDDSFFQDKLKSKVHPIPRFSYFRFAYKDKDYGVFEIPLSRYPELIAPTVKMKGAEVGKIYIRRGSTNSEAVGKEIIHLDKWIQTVELDSDFKRKVAELIEEINSGKALLSSCVSKALKLANDSGDEEFIRFCKGELLGWYPDNVELSEASVPKHRQTKVMASMYQIQNVSIWKGESFDLYRELKEDNRFREINFLIQDSITQVETTINTANGNGYITINRKLGDIAPDAPSPDLPIFIYTVKSVFVDIYDRTKVDLLKRLLKLQ